MGGLSAKHRGGCGRDTAARMKKTQELTEWQKARKKAETPTPPQGLSRQAKTQFLKIVKKIIYRPTEDGGLSISYENLTVEETFAIGIAGNDDWSLIPQQVQEELRKMQPERVFARGVSLEDASGITQEFAGLPCTIPATDPDLVRAINQARNSTREKILLNLYSASISEQQLKFRQAQQKLDDEKHEQWRKWQTCEIEIRPNFASKSKKEQANRLKQKYSIPCSSDTIRKRLN